ncbi:formate/nitrite transporter family protein [bacterium]|nr:formate/nitrite transporter family protein [bacterium]
MSKGNGESDVLHPDTDENKSSSEQAEDELGLSSLTVYEIISLEGLEEMRRPLKSLWWSGVIAGLAISMSLYVMAALRITLPGEGKHILENFGYAVGFLIVILSRLQLFTENTITPILPALKSGRAAMGWQVLRLWSVVFIANLVGTFIAAAIPLVTPMFSTEHVDAMLEISHHFADRPLNEVFFSAIPAGFLVAVMVWMLPSSKRQEVWVITIITFTIAILDTSHVIVGSTEMFILMLHEGSGLTHAMPHILTAGIGNIIGGSVLFAVLAYAQVSKEIE